MIKIFVSVGIGICDIIGVKISMESNKIIVWIMLVNLVCVLDLMVIFVWVMVVVVGILLKKGSNRFFIFCVINFWLLFNDLFVIWLVEVLYNKFLIIFNRVMLIVGIVICCKVEKLKFFKFKWLLLINVCGMLLIVVIGKWYSSVIIVVKMMVNSELGICFDYFFG